MVVKYGAPLLKPGSSSSIVLTGGTISYLPIPNWSVVAGYASGLHGMVRNLSLDLKVRVNLVTPGGVQTEMWEFGSKEENEAWAKSFEKTTVTGRVGRVEDVVQAYLYCMKDENFVGGTIVTEGGYALVPKGGL
jgi:NAD(P)-dependent dehydrogenase (short-subunit alcohol dehydrogenase family)